VKKEFVEVKFDNKEFTAGLNGIGMVAVNALSDKLEIMVNLSIKDLTTTSPWIKEKYDELKTETNSVIYCLTYSRGELVSEEVITIDHVIDLS
jgi:DNA gyrase/topoisomerase IV subunit B